MIRRLVLESFGKFTDRIFDLAPVTVFHGPNEAGKSTIFDALAYALCGPAGIKGKRAARYGKGAAARALLEDGTEAPGKVEATEYFNFLAIRSEKVEIPMSSEGVWVDRVKNSLFAGGINPEVIARDLEKSLREGKKADAAIDASCRTSQARVGEARARLAGMERERAELGKAAGELARLETELAALTVERDNAVRERNRSAAVARYREDRSILADLEALERQGGRAAMADESEALRSLMEGSRRAAAAALEAKAAESMSAQALSALEEGRARCRNAALAAEPGIGLARDLLERLERENVIRESHRRRPSLAGLLCLILLPLAASAAFFLGILIGLPAALGLGLMAAGALLGLLLFFVTMRTETIRDDSRPRQALERAAAEWTSRMGRGQALPSGGMALALSWLRAVIAEGEAAVKESVALESRLRSAEAERGRLRAAREEAEAAEASANAALRLWLSARGFPSPEAYQSSLGSEAERGRQAQETARAVRTAMEERGCARAEELRAELRREMDSLEALHGSLAAESPRPAAAMEARLSAANAAYEGTRKLLEELRVSTGRVEAVAGRDESGYLDELARAEEALSALEAQKAAASLRQASDLAALEVFTSMAASGAASFAALSTQAAAYYGKAVGRDAEISLDSLNLDAARVPDATGVPRSPENLSLGTRDCFVLACRLALAQNMVPPGSVMVLDEPFKNLDASRLRGAVEMLASYRSLREAQLFLFTKDPELVAAITSLFPSEEFQVYDLASPAAEASGRAASSATAPAGARKERKG